MLRTSLSFTLCISTSLSSLVSSLVSSTFRIPQPHFLNPSLITSKLNKMMLMSSLTSTHPPPITQLHFSASSISPLENSKSMKQLKQIHTQLIKTGNISDPVEQGRILAFCCTSETGDMDYAREVFDQIPQPNLYMWNTMIRGYSRSNSPKVAAFLYLDMLERGFGPDDYTFPYMLKAFTHEIAFQCGKEFHAQIVKFGLSSNVYVQNALMNMYSLSGRIDMARRIFNENSTRDVVSWNAMIAGYNRAQQYEESRKLFHEMERAKVQPTVVSLVSVLSACAKLKDLETGERVHQYVKDGRVISNLRLENALIDMYGACGRIDVVLELFEGMKVKDVITWTTMVTAFSNSGQVDRAREFFDQMPERDYMSWTVMIDGYLKSNRFKEALEIFREMQAAKIRPDEFTMVSILTACAQLGALEVGEWIRSYIDKNKIKKDIFVGNALIDMYCKCGNIMSARQVFDEMPRKDKFTWTAMINGLAVNGHGDEALDLFSKMLKASVAPDEVTYVGVLCACTHRGMVEEGRLFFSGMTTRHEIEPNMVHYGCMVDLLGRAGHLMEALEFIKNMPMRPNSVVWGTFLGACRIHKDADLAEMAAKRILELEPENGAVYVLLSNMYAASNKWKKVRELRQMMMEKGIKKTPGCSLIEMKGIIHEFVAGDKSHSRSSEIYSKLDEMSQELKLAGYIPDTSEVFLDLGEEEKETSLYQHSEKLAIAFGLISSEPGVTIRIVKNLRMCVDCHRAAKLISKVYDREVIVRDRTRFHHFRSGSCSCKDYW